MKIARRIQQAKLITPLLIASVSFATIFLIMSFLARMVADDYAYFQSMRTAPSYLDFLFNHYATHNGRFSQAAFITTTYALFHETAVKVLPFVLFAALSSSLGWLIYLTAPIEKNKGKIAFILGTFISATALFTMPSLFDSYLWLTSSTVYLGSIICLLINTSLVIHMTRMKRYRPLIILPIFVFMFFSQSFNEPASALAIALTSLWLVIELIRKNKKRIKLSASVLAVLIAGFLVIVLSPGTAARRADMHSVIDLSWMVFGSFEHYLTLASYITPWVIGLTIVAGFVLARSVRIKPEKKTYILSTLLALLILLSSTYITFFVNNYASGGYALRNFSLPVFGFTIAMTMLFATGFHALLHYTKLRSSLVIAVVVIGAVSSLCAVMYSTNYIKTLAIRGSALTERQLSIAKQLQSNPKTIIVQAAPVLTVSDAVDVENPDKEQTNWLIGSVRDWYNIPVGSTMIIEKTDVSYCVLSLPRTKPEFVCN